VNTLGGNVFTLTSPLPPSDAQALTGHTTMKGDGNPEFVLGWFRTLADELQAAGRTVEANEVRDEVRQMAARVGGKNR